MAKARYDDLKDLKTKVDFIEDLVENRTSILQDKSMLLESKLAMIDEKVKMMNEMISLLRQNMDMAKERRPPPQPFPEESVREEVKCTQNKTDEVIKTNTVLPSSRTRSAI